MKTGTVDAATGTRDGVQKSGTPAYHRAYQRAHYGTVSARLKREEKAAFRAACQRKGTTAHAVIAELVADWMILNGDPFFCQ